MLWINGCRRPHAQDHHLVVGHRAVVGPLFSHCFLKLNFQTSLAGDPRMSISTISTNSQPSHRVLRRSTSDTAYSPTQTPSPQSILAPPVPRIPSMYSTYTPDDTELSTYRSDRSGTPHASSRLAIPRNEASSPGPRSGDSSVEDSQAPFILSPVR